ncbi:hypothetical protein CDD81_5691 [Ophiocordyceps australis]|uniref:Uncharacterized protein n=1 Tax=Ophiocordyceps australis TaxID=1399860 RepID=A0A2C5X9W2_9HYPO|nr:hypothetical protein CDD81_5691 [Ophiocordyceps australis]
MAPGQEGAGVLHGGGRGGAGNYHVQPSSGSDDDDGARIPIPHSTAAMTGRGGAGNVVSDTEPQPAAHRISLPRRASSRSAMAGRGGAGNWKTGDDEAAGEARHVRDELDRQVREVVDRGLRVPEQVHHGRDKSQKSA